jgi:hypothetical protein
MEHNLRENTSKAAYLNQIQRLEVTVAPDVLTRLSPYQLCLRQSSLRAPSGYACKGC